MKAKDLRKLIPSAVRITRNVTYEVVWVDEFLKDAKQLGECWFDGKQIKINKNQSNTEAYKTYLHEVIHAISFETDGLNLTETQVRKLEDGLYRMYKLNGILEKL